MALWAIESISIGSGPSCGESYVSARTLHEIERIKPVRKSVTLHRMVAAAAFETVGAD